jgi:hypothetical protein
VIANAARETMASFCLTPSFGAVDAVECAGFIPMPPFIRFFENGFYSKEGFQESTHSNKPLAVELERENPVPARIFCRPCTNFPSGQAAAPVFNEKDLFKCSTR